jgi:hypothetical protein
MRRGQPRQARREKEANNSLAEIAAEIGELFEREIQLLKSEGGLKDNQIAEYEKIATRIAELFAEMRKLK